MNIKELLKDLRDTAVSLKDFIIQVADRKILRAAILHFILTLFSDELVFEYGGVSLFYIIRIKIIFLIILIIIWHLMGYLVKNYSKSEDIRDFIKFSGIYFAVMMLFQLALWPFIVGDQMYYCYFADSVYLTNAAIFQGIFIKYFRIYSLMLVPNLAGIVIVQLCVISLIIGYVMLRIKKHFGLAKWAYLFYIPFLTPVVIQHNLHIEKDILYSYFIFLLLAHILIVRLKQDKRLNINLFIIAVFYAIAASIRPEGIILFIVMPVLIYLLNYKEINLRKIILFLIFSVFSSFIFVPNYMSTVLLNKNGHSYTNMYILNDSFKVLLQKAINMKDEYILDEFKSNTNLKSEELCVKDIDFNIGFFINLPKRDQIKFQIISNKLIQKYFYDYIKYKFTLFYEKIYITDLNTNIRNLGKYDDYADSRYQLIKNKLTQISPYIYSEVIGIFSKYNAFIRGSYYNFLAISIIMVYGVILLGAILISEKKLLIELIFIISYLIFQILMSPFPNLRFYFPCYITGYFFMFYLIFYFIGNKNRNVIH